MGGVGVGHSQMPYQAFGLQFLKVGQGIQIARIGIVPGVELQQVEAVTAQAVERRLNGGPHISAAVGSRPRMAPG